MTNVNNILLTLLLNSIWQITLLADIVAFCSLLLRRSGARIRHYLFVAGLFICIFVPILNAYHPHALMSFAMRPNASAAFSNGTQIHRVIGGTPPQSK
jgi:hypothetical protein